MISKHKSNVSRSNKDKLKYAVTLTVKNGPFSTKSEAEKSARFLSSKGIKVESVTKSGKGFMFNSKVSYGMASTVIKGKVISKLKSHAKASGLKASSYKITSKQL